jgi:hypothetical protein
LDTVRHPGKIFDENLLSQHRAIESS